MDLFLKLGDALRDLFKDLFHPEKRAATELKMEDIIKTASLIGGHVLEEAKILQADVVRYLNHPKDKKLIDRLKKDAMKLEQETREI